MASFQSVTAKVLTSTFIALVVLAFAFSFDAPQRIVGGGALAQVGSYKITERDYSQQYNATVEMMKLRNGGKAPTGEQIEAFRLRHQALKETMERKLYTLLGRELGVQPGSFSIRSEIKGVKSFESDGAFDLVKYKNLLRANGLSPADYENMIGDDLVLRKARDFTFLSPFSKAIAAHLWKMKEVKREISLVQVKNTQIKNFIKVSDKEIDEYLASEEGKGEVKKLFERKKNSFDQEEKIKASHILFKGKDSLKRAQDVLREGVNQKNFRGFCQEVF